MGKDDSSEQSKCKGRELSVDCERNWLKEMEAEKKFEEKKKDLKKSPQMKTKVKKLFPEKEWLEKLNFAWKQSLMWDGRLIRMLKGF